MANKVKGESRKEGTAMGQYNGKKIVGAILCTLGGLGLMNGTGSTGNPAEDFGAALALFLFSGHQDLQSNTRDNSFRSGYYKDRSLNSIGRVSKGEWGIVA
jgi:hypothetical protein